VDTKPSGGDMMIFSTVNHEAAETSFLNEVVTKQLRKVLGKEEI
jgi:hypothetical protein